ncbi:MAG: BamA/TamA family outer membrane protein [Bacteroidota bacterium]
MRRIIFTILASIFMVNFSIGQEDSTNTDRKSRIFPVPALTYTPETQLTLGGAMFYFFDLAKGDASANMSNLQALAVYTTANQVLIDSKWNLYTRLENFVFTGRAFYHIYPDRHYGYGNNADSRVDIFDKETGETTSTNYLLFKTQRLHFAPVILRKVTKNLFAGIQYEYEYLYDFKAIPDSITSISSGILDVPVTGPRSGLGWNITYDSRTNPVNPEKGHFIQFQNWFFSEIFGSQYTYSVFRVDARTYPRLFKDHNLALQLVVDQRYTEDEQGIPMRGLARFGGADLIRGYFYGTYQAENLLMFQAEYRLPVMTFGEKFPFFKGLGLVGFIGGGQVFNEWQEVGFNQFRLAIGGGMRLLLDKEKRLNVGIDFGYGLHPGSDFDGNQTGFYFFMGEAF